jgi:hypothetical protein
MIFIFFVEGSGGGVLRVLIGGNEKEYIVILCWGTHWESKKNEKKLSPPPSPSSQNFLKKKAKHFECTLGPSIDCMKFLFQKKFVIV